MESAKTTELRRRVEVAHALAERQAGGGLRPYLQQVVIDSRPEPCPFRVVARDWQWRRVDYLTGPLEAAAGVRPPWTGPRAFWETLPRGHDKTSGLARLINWLIAFARTPVEVVSGSGDVDQAALLLEAMEREAQLNPWLKRRLRFGGRRVRGPGGVLKTMTSDAPSAFGLRPDVVVCDEITHWKKDELWQALWSARVKRPHCVFLVITNAGSLGSWQHELLLAAQDDTANWLVYEAPGQLDSWMSQEQIAADRKLLRAAEARRVFDNVWIDPSEESGYLLRSEVEACEALGRDLGLTYRTRGERDSTYLLSVDYGPKKDRTVLAVMHQDNVSAAVWLDQLQIWQGSPENPIQIAAIHEWIEDQRRLFNVELLVLDPYQLECLAQEYSHHLRTERFEARGGKANYELAECLRSAVVNKQIVWYPGAGALPVAGRSQPETLVDELSSLVLKQTTYGYRIDHESTKHDDRAVTIGMGLVMLLNDPRAAPWVPPGKIQNTSREERPIYRPRSTRTHGLYGMEAKEER